MRLLEVLDPLLSNFAPTFSDCCKGCKGSSYALMSWPTNSTQSSFETFGQTCGQIMQLTVKVVSFLSVFLPWPKVRLKIHYATKNTNSHSDTWNHGLIPRAGEASSLQLKTFQQWCKILERLKYPVRWDCLISPWGQFWERVLLKHKCIQNL